MRLFLFPSLLLAAAASGVSPLGWCPSVVAQTTFQSNAVADTFVGTNGPGYLSPPNPDAPNGNYGGAGAMQIAAAGTDRGERQTVIRFDLSGAVTAFNTAYGVGKWTLSGAALRLGSNFSIQSSQPNNTVFDLINAGLFDIRWMVNDSWVEGAGNPNSPATVGLTYNTLPSLLTAGDFSLGAFTFVPAATAVSQATYTLGLNAGFVSDISGGNLVSLHLLAADSAVSYLINSRTFADPNNPTLFVTASPVPEPSSLAFALGLTGLGGIAAARRRQSSALESKI